MLMPQKNDKGYTLIELLIVVAIIGILAAIAVPSYNAYMVRSKVAEMLTAADSAKTAIATYMSAHNGQFPQDAAQAGVSPVSSPMVSSLSIGSNNGEITVVANKDNVGAEVSITLKPTFEDNMVNWSCQATGQQQFVPSSCQGPAPAKTEAPEAAKAEAPAAEAPAPAEQH